MFQRFIVGWYGVGKRLDSVEMQLSTIDHKLDNLLSEHENITRDTHPFACKYPHESPKPLDVTLRSDVESLE